MRWQAALTLSQAALQLLVAVVLGRMLPPEDFGVIGLAMLYVELTALLAQLGVGPAIVQRRELEPLHLRVGFTLSLAVGLLGTLTLYALAPLVTSGVETAVVRLVSLSFLVHSMSVVCQALLTRELRFRTLFRVHLAAYLLGYALPAIALAVAGMGVWSLAIALVVQSVLQSALLWASRPHNPLPSLAGRQARDLLRFGLGLTLGNLANYAARNGDYLLVRHILGASALGLYSRAYAFAVLPMKNVASFLSNSMFPVYALVQDDRDRLRSGYYASVAFVSFIALPSMAVLAVLAPEVILGLLGEPWREAIVPLQILTVVGVARPLYSLGDALAKARGWVYSQFARHAVYALLVATGTGLGARYGLVGVSVGVVCAVLTMCGLMFQLSVRACEGRWRDLLACQRAGLLLGLSVGGTCLGAATWTRAAHWPHLAVLASGALAAGLAGWLTLRLVPIAWLGGIPDMLARYGDALLPPRLLTALFCLAFPRAARP